jgi:hypothetical protein
MLGPGLAFHSGTRRRLESSLRSRSGLGDLLAFRTTRQVRRDGPAIRISAVVDQTRVEAVLFGSAEGPSHVSSFVNMQRTSGWHACAGLLDGMADAVQRAALPRRVRRRDARGGCGSRLGGDSSRGGPGEPAIRRAYEGSSRRPTVGHAVRGVVARQLQDALRPPAARARCLTSA